MSDELTGRDLDRAIAEAMGWRVECHGPAVYRLVFKGAYRATVIAQSEYEAVDLLWVRAFALGVVPRYHDDAGAALALVRDVLDKLNAQSIGKGIATSSSWEFRMTADGVSLTEFGMLFGSDYGGYEVEGRNAEALARLALKALRGEGGAP